MFLMSSLWERGSWLLVEIQKTNREKEGSVGGDNSTSHYFNSAGVLHGEKGNVVEKNVKEEDVIRDEILPTDEPTTNDKIPLVQELMEGVQMSNS